MDSIEQVKSMFGGEEVQQTPMPTVNNSAFSSLIGFIPQKKEEKKFCPRVLNGKYNAVITKIERMSGEWSDGNTYDNYNVNLQVSSNVDAKVDGVGTYLGNQYPVTNIGIQDLCSDIFTATGINIAVEGNTEDELYASFELAIRNVVGSEVTVKVWPKLSYRKDDNGKFVVRKKGDFDVTDMALFNSKDRVIKCDKNGYVVHKFQFVEKMETPAEQPVQ